MERTMAYEKATNDHKEEKILMEDIKNIFYRVFRVNIEGVNSGCVKIVL